MAPKFALFTKGSKLLLNKGFKNMFELHSLALNPRHALFGGIFFVPIHYEVSDLSILKEMFEHTIQ